MRIAILGGGFTGLTAAYYLAKRGHNVTLFEKEKVLGGLAVGFKGEGWDWYLERAYHHLLDSEDDILNFAKDLGFNKIFFKETRTDSLYKVDDIYRIFPVDTPQDFLKFPLLSLPQKLRTGLILAFLKTSPFFSLYENYTSKEFLSKTMGEKVWKIFWQDLFRKKFGKYAENILASFIWARVKKRAKRLGYIEGGFQALIDVIEKENFKLSVKVNKGFEVRNIEKSGEAFNLSYLDETQGTHSENFDIVVSTLPTVILGKITRPLFSQSYLERFKKLHYLHAVVLILETKEPILKDTYWLNVCSPDLPLMLVAQHTNFIDKKHYGGNHIAYIGWYVDRDDPLLKMDSKSILNFCLPDLKKISPNRELQIINRYLFHGPFAQPIFDRDFLENKPDFITPVKNFYIANLDMTYPYDRGTNYAVKLGREAAGMI